MEIDMDSFMSCNETRKRHFLDNNPQYDKSTDKTKRESLKSILVRAKTALDEVLDSSS
jgi:hypothetical protein